MSIALRYFGVFVAVFLVACSGAPDARDMAPQAVADLIAGDASVVVLDVRTPPEFSRGHLPRAVNVDYLGDNFEQQLSNLDPAATTVVYCRSGNRSSKSLPFLDKLGFRDARHLKGGVIAWERAGLKFR